MSEISRPDMTYQWASGGVMVTPSSVKLQTGWGAEVPPYQWENYIQNRQDNAIVHLFQKGISVWSATQDYYFTTSGTKAFVQGSDGKVYEAVQSSTNQNPTTDTTNTYWKVAFRDQSGSALYALDTGTTNVYKADYTPVVKTLIDGMVLKFKVLNSNTTTSTFTPAVGVIAAAPIVGGAHSPLQGGEMVANGDVWVQWNTSIGTAPGSWVLIDSTGGALQVQTATKSQHTATAAQIQTQSLTAFTSTGTAPAFILTPVPAITAYAAAQCFQVTFSAAGGATPTLNVSGAGAKNLKQYDSGGNKVSAVITSGQVSDVVYDGTDFVVLDQLPVALALSYNYFSGFVMANNATTPNTTLDIGIGAARDSTNTLNLSLSTTLSGILQVSGVWAAGNNQNKLDTGAVAISTTYHVFIIRKTSDGTGDILFSLSPTAPTMPTGYSGFRRIGRIITDGSSNIRQFFDRKDGSFDWKDPIIEVTQSAVGTGSSLLTLTGLGGSPVEARLNIIVGGDGVIFRATPADVTNSLISSTITSYTGGIVNDTTSSAEIGGGPATVFTNTSGQIMTSYKTGTGNVSYRVITMGYKEVR